MSAPNPSTDPTPSGPPPRGHHLATLGHGGRFWEVHVEFEEEPQRMDAFGARLCFTPADPEDEAPPHRTATILIEPSYEEVLYRARSFEEHQLVALLRSCLPDD